MKVHDHSPTKSRRPPRPGGNRRPSGSPKKSLGQHFLRDPEIAVRIVEAARIEPGELVLEIGPGRGAITEMLVNRAGRMVLVELDGALADMLTERYLENQNIRVIESDARDLDLSESGDLPEILERSYKVVANLPYYAASPIIRRFLEADNPPAEMVVMVQREVAREMAAPEGRMGLLSVATQYYADVEVVFDVPAAAFIPPPKVVSSVIRLVKRASPPLEIDDEPAFFSFVRAGFKAPRKQLHNSLARGLLIEIPEAAGIIARAGLDPVRRPRTLSTAEWGRLYEARAGMQERAASAAPALVGEEAADDRQAGA
ncbi:MAG: 16S rRNA (adenine(1518)-N(6)/adenine(1519)-N(6))-dimethyltransferase RsmA [Chloroflexi bacterium]|nr:16S rRNA (adenine(1518)-N(6)/adenine(1519)-N(6))-dimethyltransferase RsmA [Chloroflexota bacterium]